MIWQEQLPGAAFGVHRGATVIPTETWDAAVKVLGDADEVALACHVNPDGDAIGSMLALVQALCSLGKRDACSWSGEERLHVPSSYVDLPGLELLVDPGGFPPAPQVFVALDTGSLQRLGTLGAVTERAGMVLVIDHHASNEGFGTVELLDGSAAATAVLVEELINRLGVPLSPGIAACLYAGLITDTASFKHVSTTPAVHHVAARLLETGIRHDVISRTIWDTNTFGYVQLLGALLSRSVLERDAVGGCGMVWSYSTRADLEAYSVVFDELEGVIDVLRTSAEAEVAVMCKQQLDGLWQVSMRSKGRVDIAAVCAELGGGGHRFAAGFTSSADVQPTMQRIRDALATAPQLPA